MWACALQEELGVTTLIGNKIININMPDNDIMSNISFCSDNEMLWYVSSNNENNKILSRFDLSKEIIKYQYHTIIALKYYMQYMACWIVTMHWIMD